MDRIKQAEVFIQVIENGSFTKAAAALNIPRSTISTVIQSLEDRLGTQLLHRTTRQVSPTHDGLIYLKAARQFIEVFEDSESLFSKNKQHITGCLRVDLPTRIGTQVVIPNLGLFIKQYPEINLTLSMNDKPVNLLSEGVDCALRVGILPDSGLVCRKLGELEMVNCASPNYLSHYGIPQKLSDLAEHYVVNYAAQFPASNGVWEYYHSGKTHSYPMKNLVTINNTEAYIAAALSGLGIIQVPAYDVTEYIQQGKLCTIMPEHCSAPMPLSLLYPQRRNLPPRIKLFQDWLVDLLTNSNRIVRKSPKSKSL